ncbi:MAG TPA: glycosyltransferase family 2 protein [Kiritimatiellia bacterium]|nr:glycosyltransferase family 2 protein [Kiritimatiellia bacterium]
MTDDPYISVVMSVYNNEDTLAAAMESILSQEGVTFEFIVIDDGSTDQSPALLDDYARRDQRIRVIHQNNQGLTAALKTGCARARAPWIARQDADDVSLPGRLAALRDLAAGYPEAAMLGSSARYVGPAGERLLEQRCTPDPEVARKQVRELGIGPPAHGCVMFSRKYYEQAGGYRACFYYGQDSDLWMRLAEQGEVAYLEEVYYQYRISPGAISGARRRLQKRFGRLGQACRDARRAGKSEAPFLEEAEALTRSIREGRIPPPRPRDQWLSFYHIGCLLESTDPEAAMAYFTSARVRHPWHWRPRYKLWRLGSRN